MNERRVVMPIMALPVLLGLLGAAHPVVIGGLSGAIWAGALGLTGISVAIFLVRRMRVALETARREGGRSVPGRVATIAPGRRAR
jgi:hypothetical protein